MRITARHEGGNVTLGRTLYQGSYSPDGWQTRVFIRVEAGEQLASLSLSRAPRSAERKRVIIWCGVTEAITTRWLMPGQQCPREHGTTRRVGAESR
jgi:hypothetical protein